jgi:uncharacterized RmlC-like cupin family protein
MSESQILGGKVLKRTLSVVQPGEEAPVLKRLALPQGELAQFYDGDEGIHYIAFIELREGTPRGNHYHKIKKEWIYLLRGELTVIAEDLDSKERATVTMSAGDLVQIHPGIAHALKIVKAGDAVEFSTARFDASDIYRYALI